MCFIYLNFVVSENNFKKMKCLLCIIKQLQAYLSLAQKDAHGIFYSRLRGREVNKWKKAAELVHAKLRRVVSIR